LDAIYIKCFFIPEQIAQDNQAEPDRHSAPSSPLVSEVSENESKRSPEIIIDQHPPPYHIAINIPQMNI
jgi:hypothetical protein